MPIEIVGRDEEMASVRAFVEGAAERPAALVLEGEAGVGKSTLWLAGVEHARAQGSRVLVSRPAEAERGLAYVALGDLLESTVDEVLPVLPAPRARALQVALLREGGADETVDARALAVATRSALDLLAAEGPVLVAIDDAQWLDPASAGALAFALRRLDGSRLRLLLARRLELTKLEQTIDVDVLRVGPLSAGALHRLLLDRLARPFPRQTLLRIHEHSGGNPFFALEVARALGDDPHPLEPLPVPDRLDELVRARLAGLPAATRDALALTAALGTAPASLLERAGVTADALEPAFAAHVIERENGAIRFAHPLLSSAVYPERGERRRDLHSRVAELVNDPVGRARHLALSADEPDTKVAAMLDDAARRATDRAASAVAGELYDHAVRLTPPRARKVRHRRALAAARAHHVAGEWTRARAIATELVAEPGTGALRAEALLLLAEFEGLERAVALLEESLREAASRPALQARIECRLAWATRFQKGFVGALEHARRALELADELNDDVLRVRALGISTFLGAAVGDPHAGEYAARAHEIATATGDEDLERQARNALAEVPDPGSHVAEARSLLEGEYEECRERDELAASTALEGLAWTELWAGRWALAADYAGRAYEIKTQYGLEVPWIHLPVAIVAAHRGELDVARQHSERALRLGEEQFGLHTPVHLGTLGFVAFQEGDLRQAVEWFAEAEAQTSRLGWREPGRRWWLGDHVEALLELGCAEEAVRILDAWEEDARRLERVWVLAQVTRCRGLVAAARGDVGAATTLLERAVTQHDAVDDAFGRARALLALGVVRRRTRRKRSARDAIEAALAGFEELGAATWVEKARAELGRIGGRVRERGLTAAERRVAVLVAEGRTNREVASALFLGERTVETHLSHVYAKLGVRSRSELARTYRPDEQSSEGLTISS